MDKLNPNNLHNKGIKDTYFKHGGNILTQAKKLNLLPSKIFDSSASLVPFEPPKLILDVLISEIKTLGSVSYTHLTLPTILLV